MKILFKNNTKYTKNVYQKFLQFHQQKYGNKYTFTTSLTIILLFFCIITNIKYSNYFTALILIFALIGFCFYSFFYPVKKVKKELKTEKFEKEKVFTFCFYDNFFTISDKFFFDKIKYWKLYRVYETDQFFYLYINKDHAFLLDKSTFVKGNINNFSKFLRRKIWFRFF